MVVTYSQRLVSQNDWHEDIEYQSHLDHNQNGYCGYWAFETPAIIYLDDLDNTELHQYPSPFSIRYGINNFIRHKIQINRGRASACRTSQCEEG